MDCFICDITVPTEHIPAFRHDVYSALLEFNRLYAAFKCASEKRGLGVLTAGFLSVCVPADTVGTARGGLTWMFESQEVSLAGGHGVSI